LATGWQMYHQFYVHVLAMFGWLELIHRTDHVPNIKQISNKIYTELVFHEDIQHFITENITSLPNMYAYAVDSMFWELKSQSILGCKVPELDLEQEIILETTDGHRKKVTAKFINLIDSLKHQIKVLMGPWREELAMQVPVTNDMMEFILSYCEYRLKYTNYPGLIPEFVIPTEISLEALMAANLLGI